jgi:hypothetical protein
MSDGTIDDITLDFKLEKKCFPRIRELADGGELGHDDDFNEIISFINARLDCSDFRMVSVLRTCTAGLTGSRRKSAGKPGKHTGVQILDG